MSGEGSITEAVAANIRNFFRRDGQNSNQVRVPAAPFIEQTNSTRSTPLADAAKENQSKPASTTTNTPVA